GGEERRGALAVPGASYLTEFRLDVGLPVWRYRVNDYIIEKRVLLPHLQNTVLVNYRLLAGDGVVRLKLRPSVHFRPHEAPVNAGYAGPYTLSASDSRYEIKGNGHPPLRLFLHAQRPAFTVEGNSLQDLLYRVEESRG